MGCINRFCGSLEGKVLHNRTDTWSADLMPLLPPAIIFSTLVGAGVIAAAFGGRRLMPSIAHKWLNQNPFFSQPAFTIGLGSGAGVGGVIGLIAGGYLLIQPVNFSGPNRVDQLQGDGDDRSFVGRLTCFGLGLVTCALPAALAAGGYLTLQAYMVRMGIQPKVWSGLSGAVSGLAVTTLTFGTLGYVTPLNWNGWIGRVTECESLEKNGYVASQA